MTRNKYVLKEQEVDTLVQGILSRGEEDTYASMRAKCLMTAETIEDMDEMLMDMHESMLEKAREIEAETENDDELKTMFYRIASMFRILAHDINLRYKKSGITKNKSSRILQLVSFNKNIPAL